jgi:hypothetical protein
MFVIWKDTKINVSEYVENNWSIQFRRMLGSEEAKEWQELEETIHGVVSSNHKEAVDWLLSKSKKFIAPCTTS